MDRFVIYNNDTLVESWSDIFCAEKARKILQDHANKNKRTACYYIKDLRPDLSVREFLLDFRDNQSMCES